MEDESRAAYSTGGHARGAYIPYHSVTPVTDHIHHRDDQHTSDGNDQHSSRDARGDCAVGQRPVLGASTDATMTGQCDPQARHASFGMSYSSSNDDFDDTYIWS